MDPGEPQAGGQAVDVVADAVGRLMEFWGFKRTMGRIWATLYLAEKPLAAAELCERLGISSGAASMTLSDLERWGVIHRLFRPGERREFFEAETHIWKMVSRVFEERERHELKRFIEALEGARAALAKADVPGAQRAATQFALIRVGRLLDLAHLGQGILSAFLERGEVDVAPLKQTDLK